MHACAVRHRSAIPRRSALLRRRARIRARSDSKSLDRRVRRWLDLASMAGSPHGRELAAIDLSRRRRVLSRVRSRGTPIEVGGGGAHDGEVTLDRFLEKERASQGLVEGPFVFGDGRPLRDGAGPTSTWNCTPSALGPTRSACTARVVVSRPAPSAPGGGSTTSASCHCRPGSLRGKFARTHDRLGPRRSVDLVTRRSRDRHQPDRPAEGVGQELVAQAHPEEGPCQLAHPVRGWPPSPGPARGARPPARRAGVRPSRASCRRARGREWPRPCRARRRARPKPAPSSRAPSMPGCSSGWC